MAIKCLSVTLFFALVVIKPVHDAFPDVSKAPSFHNGTLATNLQIQPNVEDSQTGLRKSFIDNVSTDYLWMYLVFAYLFTGLAIFIIVSETESIIDVRQEYLGHQSTVTDRTIRISGIPTPLRSEEKIKAFVEGLEIGNVDSVMLCKNWEQLDDCVDRRTAILRKLETSWTVYTRGKAKENVHQVSHEGREAQLESSNERRGDEESSPLLGSSGPEHTAQPSVLRARPKATIHYGPLKLRSRYVDAIDYYEEKLRRTDEKIAELRKRSFEPTPVAFVTMDGVPAAVCFIDSGLLLRLIFSS